MHFIWKWISFATGFSLFLPQLVEEPWNSKDFVARRSLSVLVPSWPSVAVCFFTFLLTEAELSYHVTNMFFTFFNLSFLFVQFQSTDLKCVFTTSYFLCVNMCTGVYNVLCCMCLDVSQYPTSTVKFKEKHEYNYMNRGFTPHYYIIVFPFKVKENTFHHCLRNSVTSPPTVVHVDKQ